MLAFSQMDLLTVQSTWHFQHSKQAKGQLKPTTLCHTSTNKPSEETCETLRGVKRFWSMFPLTRVPFWYRF